MKDSLGYTLKRAQVRSYEMLFELLGPGVLSPGRMTALSIVGTEDGINQSSLAERLGITRPSVFKVIDALEALGLMERRSIPNDRRSYALGLTPLGKDALRNMREQLRLYEAAIATHLSAAERKQLMALLDKVAVP